MCSVNATFMPLTLSLWNVRCRKEHSPVWCSPWPSGWRGSASPERPKHLHSLPYGQQNSLGKPRKTWWEHFNVPWSYLAQQDLILITWTWEDGARGILILCILSQSHNCPAGMGSAVIPMKFSIENNSSGSLFLWLFLHLVAYGFFPSYCWHGGKGLKRNPLSIPLTFFATQNIQIPSSSPQFIWAEAGLTSFPTFLSHLHLSPHSQVEQAFERKKGLGRKRTELQAGPKITCSPQRGSHTFPAPSLSFPCFWWLTQSTAKSCSLKATGAVPLH